MGREKKSPGLKILWVWTIGTAASITLFLSFLLHLILVDLTTVSV